MDSSFSQVEIEDPPTSAKRVTRKNKKSVPYYEDPEILKRLSRVAELMLTGTPAWKIAEQLRVSLATAKRDIGRVREIWRTEASEKLDSLLGDALAQYTKVQSQAWQKANDSPERADRYLAIILNAQERIDKLAGIAPPEKVNVSVDGEIGIRNIEEVREQRWKQVQSEIKEIVKGG